MLGEVAEKEPTNSAVVEVPMLLPAIPTNMVVELMSTEVLMATRTVEVLEAVEVIAVASTVAKKGKFSIQAPRHLLTLW